MFRLFFGKKKTSRSEEHIDEEVERQSEEYVIVEDPAKEPGSMYPTLSSNLPYSVDNRSSLPYPVIIHPLVTSSENVASSDKFDMLSDVPFRLSSKLSREGQSSLEVILLRAREANADVLNLYCYDFKNERSVLQ